MEIKSTKGKRIFFTLEGVDGEWSIPTPDALMLKDMLALMKRVKGADETQAIEAFVDFIDKVSPGLSDVVALGEIQGIMQMWLASGNLGESLPSPKRSKKGTAGR